jgi:extracellular factor (EF) 3-hydroxypalmitic acid methyl ester biosynthesis protein
MATNNRQLNSTVTFRNSQGIEARGSLIGITRQTISMEVYDPYSVAQMSEMLTDLTVRRQGRVVYQGSAVVTSLVNTGIYLVLSATLTEPWKDATEVIGDRKALREEVDQFLIDLDVYKNVRPEFQLVISRMRTDLSEISRWIEQIDMVADARGVGQSGTLQDEYVDEIKASVLPHLAQHMSDFEGESRFVPPELSDIHRVFAQRDLHPLMLRSPFVHRTYVKPLGYAGDYEMVNMMVRNPNEGPSTYFKIINSLFLAGGPAEAHRNRIVILLKHLNKQIDDAIAIGKTIKILNLGCGPAVEIQQLLEQRNIPEAVELTLIDFSQETLDYTYEMITRRLPAHGSGMKLNIVHRSVDQILRQSAKIKETDRDTYDFIYCAGLFDYFSQKACSRVLKLFHALVKPGCWVLSTNVHKDNPAQASMEYLAEWHLVYRNEKDMQDLIPADWEQNVYCDKTGVNVFLEYKKAEEDS